ncbi:MAG: lipoprotein signal peptidase [Pseudoflavonifractor sp.]|nr:lipoprotein signal peptidase [Alloprevotella sp.]MCM1116053.1 lipoprotein signal peptidase [Pseudoflavonifractor sp.]
MTPRLLHKGLMATLVAILIIVADQWLKIWVKTHFHMGEDLEIFPWFQLFFIENNGMAFGLEMGSKLLLSIFRVIAVGALAYYIWWLTRPARAVRTGYIICVSLIMAGAAGNIIDCLFYGLIFDNPAPPAVATIFPPDGGYAPFLHGRVVDMLYFPLFSFDWPAWLPIIGGQHFIFFQPVFNLADAAISVGVIWLFIFYSRYISELHFPSDEQARPS